MERETIPNHTPMKAKPLVELLPDIQSILSKEMVQSLIAIKQSKSTVKRETRTSEKAPKPMPIAELNALIQSTKKNRQPSTTSTSTVKLRPWNSSVKVDKTKTVTAGGKIKHSSVRKVLNFPPNPRPTVQPTPKRRTLAYSRAKKSDHKLAQTEVPSISGVSKIPETPVIKKRLEHHVPKILNHSIESNNDNSFIQRENEIDLEEKCNALTEEATLEKITEITPPTSTPFKEYRNLNLPDDSNVSDADDSIVCNNTLTFFDAMSANKENSHREESVIVSLCEMLGKTTFKKSEIENGEICDAKDIETQMENDLNNIDKIIEMLNSMKQEKLMQLQIFRRNNTEKKEKCLDIKNNGTIACKSETKIKIQKASSRKSSHIHRDNVIKSKLPSYSIPKKTACPNIPRETACLRKKVFCKSMPNVTEDMITPIKSSDKALNMYMQIKEKMTFLNTPLTKPHNAATLDTPTVTSCNLQQQLDKLYNE